MTQPPPPDATAGNPASGDSAPMRHPEPDQAVGDPDDWLDYGNETWSAASRRAPKTNAHADREQVVRTRRVCSAISPGSGTRRRRTPPPRLKYLRDKSRPRDMTAPDAGGAVVARPHRRRVRRPRRGGRSRVARTSGSCSTARTRPTTPRADLTFFGTKALGWAQDLMECWAAARQHRWWSPAARDHRFPSRTPRSPCTSPRPPPVRSPSRRQTFRAVGWGTIYEIASTRGDLREPGRATGQNSFKVTVSTTATARRCVHPHARLRGNRRSTRRPAASSATRQVRQTRRRARSS